MSPSATLAMQSEGRCRQVPRLPRKVTVDVTKRHACHAKRRPLSASATPATQTAAATTVANGNQAGHQSQPSAISATSATQSDGRCHQAPRLPRNLVVWVKWCVVVCGKWCVVSGVWVSGVWVRGVWVSGVWVSGVLGSGVLVSGVWVSCVWVSGV